MGVEQNCTFKNVLFDKSGNFIKRSRFIKEPRQISSPNLDLTGSDILALPVGDNRDLASLYSKRFKIVGIAALSRTSIFTIQKEL